MRVFEKTTEFDRWFNKLKDLKAKAKILFRIQKIQSDDHFGDTKPVGNGISELRIHYAKGYRVYFVEKDKVLVILLAGGDKSTQIKDIQKAKKIWEEIKK
jgi:putative addiction module killer protein